MDKEKFNMDSHKFKVQWKNVQGDLKAQWGKLTIDDLNSVGGSVDKLEDMLQQRYGFSREEAHRRIAEWFTQRGW
jgi:uncharacterized protein YjbJ (UPF0337 family)